MPYDDLANVQATDPGDILSAAWCDQARDNFEFLIDPPVCSVFHSTTQNVGDSSATDLVADSEAFNNDSMHSTVTNTGRITIQTAGRYLLTCNMSFALNSSGYRQAQFRLNDTTFFGTDRRVAPTGVAGICQATATRVLAAGDYIEVNAFQNSGGTLAVTLVEFTAIFLTR